MNYTSKRNVEFSRCSPLEDSASVLGFASVLPCSSKSVTRMQSNGKTDWSVCIFCNRKSCKKDKILHKVQTFSGQQSIFEAANTRNDEDMLRQIRGIDLIAVEALYHKSCMPTYTSKINLEKYMTPNENLDPFDFAFECLVKDITEDLDNGKVFKVVDLLMKFKAYCQ